MHPHSIYAHTLKNNALSTYLDGKNQIESVNNNFFIYIALSALQQIKAKQIEW